MKITMEGKWARRGSPTEQVRILCIDRPGSYPVVFLNDFGTIGTCRSDGSYQGNPKGDLVPLEEPPIVRWGIVTKDGGYYRTFGSKEDALGDLLYRKGGRIVKLQEVK